MTHGSLCEAHACVRAGVTPARGSTNVAQARLWQDWRCHCHCKQVSKPCCCLCTQVAASVWCWRWLPRVRATSAAPRCRHCKTASATATVAATRGTCTKGLPGANLAPGVHDPGWRQCVHNRSEPTSPWSVDCAWRGGWRGCRCTGLADSPACAHDAKPRSTYVPRWSLADETPRHSLQAFVEGTTLDVYRVYRRTCMLRAARAGVALARVAGASCAALMSPNEAGVATQECTQPCDAPARSRVRTLPQWWAGRGRGGGGRRYAVGGAARKRAPHWYVLLWRPQRCQSGVRAALRCCGALTSLELASVAGRGGGGVPAARRWRRNRAPHLVCLFVATKTPPIAFSARGK